jgi:hypothetical protein
MKELQRGDLFDKRQELMAEWGKYSAGPEGTTTATVESLKA